MIKMRHAKVTWIILHGISNGSDLNNVNNIDEQGRGFLILTYLVSVYSV